jgi:hypothetical protein
MIVRPSYKRSIPGDIEIDTVTVSMTRDELTTVYYALEAYKADLLETAGAKPKPRAPEDREPTVEDEAFCFTLAGRCASAQFDIEVDGVVHNGDLEQYRKWLDI